jgi:hypothetical protein
MARRTPRSPGATALMLLALVAVAFGTGGVLARKKQEPAGRPFTATIDAIADPAFPLAGKRYYFESGMPNIGTEDLEFREVARWLAYALGHPVAASREDADVLVRVAFGIGVPQTTRSTVVTAPGYSYPIGMYWYSAPPLTETVVNTTYTRRLLVEAYDLKTPGRLPQVWKTSVTSVGSIGDLRYVLPFMIAMGGDYFQKNAGHQQLQIPDDARGRVIVDSWIGPAPAATTAAPAAAAPPTTPTTPTTPAAPPAPTPTAPTTPTDPVAPAVPATTSAPATPPPPNPPAQNVPTQPLPMP